MKYIHNYIGIRAGIEIGNITHYDLLTVLPFDSRLLTVNITGRDLLLALENSVARYDKKNCIN